jgi:predicted ATPase
LHLPDAFFAGVPTVIESLHLKRFKNFQEATLTLGPLTVLIGANASGKSNIRDAFRLLHGIGRGYSLADTFGGSYVGGGQVWSGIRGGAREAAYSGSRSFELSVEMRLPQLQQAAPPIAYSIEVASAETAGTAPRVVNESLNYALVFGKSVQARGTTGFRVVEPGGPDKSALSVSLFPQRGARGNDLKTYAPDAPILYQLTQNVEGNHREARALARFVVDELRSFRFLDLSPSQMRIPSQPGQTTLGDRGENLSSVLAAVCADGSKKETLLAWIRKLTPMDVDDLVFDAYSAGRIILSLKEKDGRIVSAESASDGTLRFLAILAAIFGPEPATFYFIEELENGIHPTRLGLLVDLIEHQAKRRGIQIVATSHSPQLLQFLSEGSLEHASLVYRLPDHTDGRIKRIIDIPEARRVIKEQPVWVLHASSWFEDVLDLTEDSDAEPVAGKQTAS